MNDVLKRLGEIGIVPVVRIEDASSAVALGRALIAGDLPVAEITFRTAAAEASIRNLTREVPELLVGAGTVLTTDQVDRALEAGARFIVSPGFNPRVVDYCLERGIPVAPGVSSPTDIEMGLERGLEVLKFFPAGPSGGLNFLKALAAPYEAVQFIPTGGIAVSDLREYLLFPRVLAVGGSWIAKDATIASGNFEEITAIAREAVMTALGFELAHVGVNEESSVTATASAQILQRLFFFPIMDGKSSLMVGGVELMKSAYLGAHGHLAIATLSVPRAIAFLARKGIGVRRETLKMKDGRPLAIYLDQEIAGFAVHLLQK